MSDALAKFARNVVRARDLVALHDSLDEITTDALDKSDLSRAALVNVVSALDDYVHTVVRNLMIDAADGRIPRTDAFDRFPVPLQAALLAPSVPTSVWLDQAIVARIGVQSFQNPDKVADALRLVSPKELWNELGMVLGSPAADLKVRLKLIVARRNQIVHEADCSPAPPYERWPMSSADALDAVNFVSDLVAVIDSLL